MANKCIKIMVTLAGILVSAFCIYAQDRTFSGKVVDPEGEAVIGAGLVCREKNSVGTVTDIDGRFSLKIPAGVKTVSISSLGMNGVEYDLGAGKLEGVVIVLEYGSSTLDQVVVTGYGQTTVKRITGSVGIMDSEKFSSKPLASVSALMQGELAGVSISASSGQPGTQSKIRIRGTNNLSGNSNPLWVVDGVPLQSESPALSPEQLATGGFDDIFVNGIGGLNPNDIESITVLKDAAAAAIYGSRAANGVIVVTTRKGKAGSMKVGYNNNFTWSFRPQRNLDLMNSSEKLDWEQELWDEFSESGYRASLSDPAVFFPIVGIVGQIRAGVGRYASMKGDIAAQDAAIDALRQVDTDWYSHLFRNAFSQNHHLSVSGGSDKYTYYVSGGVNDENGMLINNRYQRYSLNANMMMRPGDGVRLDMGVETSRQRSKSPDSYVNAFRYAYFANPYEKPYEDDGSYAADETFFSLGYYNGRGVEQVMPLNGFNILRELNSNYTETVNTAATVRGQLDLKLAEPLHFIGLASYSFSDNSTDKVVDKDSYTAFRDRLGNDDRSQTKIYGNISQNRTDRDSYVLRGHLSYRGEFGNVTLNVLAGSEIRGSKANTVFTKRYNYDPVTGTSSLPQISGPEDQWLTEVEKLNGQYFSESRFASFYSSADAYLGKSVVLNASFRTDGSSNFGSNRQFNPTWSAGAAWHMSEESWMPGLFSHATLRAAFGYTGDVNTSTSHLLVLRYLQQEYRYWGNEAYKLGTIPSAPNPDLGWEKTADGKVGLDLGLWKDRLNINTEAYLRMSSDVVTSSIVPSTVGFYSVYFNSADILNSGAETTVSGKILDSKDFSLNASVNFAYNYNKVTRYRPSSNMKVSSKDRYVEGYPVGAIMSGNYSGIDSSTGLYRFRLRDDAVISTISDLNDPDNYRHYLGTTIAPFTGGFSISMAYKNFRMSLSGVYSFGNKVYDKISSPASYLNALHSGVSTEEVQSEHSDLYSNHLNVTRDRTDRWTAANTENTRYPRIYDRFNAIHNFAASNPMDYSIVDAIYVKDLSYLRLKTLLLSYGLPQKYCRRLHLDGISFNVSFNNFLTITGYDGMDPEVPGATYPTTRSISCGFSLDF